MPAGNEVSIRPVPEPGADNLQDHLESEHPDACLGTRVEWGVGSSGSGSGSSGSGSGSRRGECLVELSELPREWGARIKTGRVEREAYRRENDNSKDDAVEDWVCHDVSAAATGLP